MFSLKSLAEALQGGPEEEEEEEEDDVEELQGGQEGEADNEGAEGYHDGDSGAEQGTEGASKQKGGPQLSFWGVASVLTATVKAKTTQVLTAVQETDWRAELEAFQQGAKEDAEAVTKGADIVMNKAKEAAEQLPATLEHLPGTTADLQARAEAAGAAARARAGRSLAGLAGLGSKLMLGTHDLLEQISYAVQNEMALIDDSGSAARRGGSSKAGHGRYSRFEADVAAMQRDSSTYCDEPEDEEAYEAWLAEFDLAARRPDIERLIAENTFMSELQARIVPLIVEYDAFWTRYFYRLHKLEQKHEQFLQLAQRAQQQEEEVGWSSDEDAEQGASVAAADEKEPTAARGQSHASVAGRGDATGQHVPHDEAHEEQEVTLEALERLPSDAAEGPVQAAHAESTTAELEDSSASPDSKASTPQTGAHQRVASSSDDSAAATLSSDSDHWQVVSPRRQSAAAAGSTTATGNQQQEAHDAAPAATISQPVGDEQAEEASAPSKPGDSPSMAPSNLGMVPASEPAAEGHQEPGAADEEELSDWGDDDEAVLAAAAAGKPGADEEENAWGSDWE